MPQSYKHKKNNGHERTSVWKGYLLLQFLLTAVDVCFMLLS